jgi:hypothetical protein
MLAADKRRNTFVEISRPDKDELEAVYVTSNAGDSVKIQVSKVFLRRTTYSESWAEIYIALTDDLGIMLPVIIFLSTTIAQLEQCVYRPPFVPVTSLSVISKKEGLSLEICIPCDSVLSMRQP